MDSLKFLSKRTLFWMFAVLLIMKLHIKTDKEELTSTQQIADIFNITNAIRGTLRIPRNKWEGRIINALMVALDADETALVEKYELLSRDEESRVVQFGGDNDSVTVV